MLDVNILLDLTEEVYQKFEARGVNRQKLNSFAQNYKKLRELRQDLETKQARKNHLVDEFAKIRSQKNQAVEDELKNELCLLKEEVRQKQTQFDQNTNDFNKLWCALANLPLDNEIPVGDESKNKVIRQWGTPTKFDFEPLNHWDILEKQKLIDVKRAVKTSGTRFVTYRGNGAKLMRALQRFTLDINTKNGYEELLPPVLVNWKSFYSSGQFPKFEEDVFGIKDQDLYLSSTGEVQLINYFRGEILNEKDLPVYLTTSTINFRSEAGSAGRDIKGLIRLHQFYKTELVKICKVEDGVKEHEKTVLNACEILERLNLPYQQVLLASMDMSASSQKTYDLEVWMPGSNKYREISSVSLCGTYQSRRAMIRYNSGQTGDNKYVATINGSSLALDRLLAAIVENYQTADGNFVIPSVLSKYME